MACRAIRADAYRRLAPRLRVEKSHFSPHMFVEALRCGFALERVDPRFLPATTRSRLPRWPWLVEAWLALRPLSSLVTGRQFLLVARRPAEGGP